MADEREFSGQQNLRVKTAFCWLLNSLHSVIALVSRGTMHPWITRDVDIGQFTLRTNKGVRTHYKNGRVSDTEIAKTATDDTGHNSHRPKTGLPRIKTTKLLAQTRILHELAK